MRVLLIDDDARLAELLEGYLTPQGVSLAHAAGGQAGLAALATGGFDAVLLDVMMPGIITSSSTASKPPVASAARPA